MRVTVKAVIFFDKNFAATGSSYPYCVYCKELMFYVNNQSSEEKEVGLIENQLLYFLRCRVSCNNLTRWGWKVSENSAIPPTFTDEEVITKVEALRRDKLVEPKIVEIDVELPKEYDLP